MSQALESQYSERVGDALKYAADVHATQLRKGKDEPYLSHLLQVAALIIRYGGTEDQIIAGLLHDAPEDHGGVERLADITARFDTEVARIVRGCSDSLSDDPDDKAPWRERKTEHLRHLQHDLDSAAALVAAADKIANLTDIVYDMSQEPADPLRTLQRFNGKVDGTRAYYAAMLAILTPQLPPAAAAHLEELVEQLGARPVGPGVDPGEDFLSRTADLVLTAGATT